MRRTIVGGLAAVALAVALPLAAATPKNRSDRDFVAAHSSGIAASPTAGGQCTTPPPVVPGPLPFNDSGNTCTPGTLNAITNYGGTCGTNLPFPYPGPEHIYQLNLGTGNNVAYSLSLTGSTGDLAMFLVGSACGTGTNCVANSQDAIGPGTGPETIAAAPQTPGTYFLYIDSYYAIGNPAACGSYALTATGTLPVELIQFDVN
jgi:hypothetical protein